MSKTEMINGFNEIDTINCVQELNIVSLWFTLLKDNRQSKPIIVKFESRKEIPKILENIKQGDTIEFTMLCNIEYIQRRTKMIKVIN